MRRSALALLGAALALIASTTEATAQQPLIFSPDTLSYPSERQVVISHSYGEPIVIDSVTAGPNGVTAFYVEVATADSVYGPQALLPEPIANRLNRTLPVGATLVEGGAAVLRVTGLDPCVVCRGGGSGSPALVVHFSFPSVVSYADTIVVDLSGYVTAEDGPPSVGAFRVDVYPNPTAGDVVLTVGRPTGGAFEAVVFDALGRIVRRTSFSGSEPSVQLQTAGLPGGVYVVQVRGAVGQVGSARFSVAR